MKLTKKWQLENAVGYAVGYAAGYAAARAGDAAGYVDLAEAARAADKAARAADVAADGYDKDIRNALKMDWN